MSLTVLIYGFPAFNCQPITFKTNNGWLESDNSHDRHSNHSEFEHPPHNLSTRAPVFVPSPDARRTSINWTNWICAAQQLHLCHVLLRSHCLLQLTAITAFYVSPRRSTIKSNHASELKLVVQGQFVLST